MYQWYISVQGYPCHGYFIQKINPYIILNSIFKRILIVPQYSVLHTTNIRIICQQLRISKKMLTNSIGEDQLSCGHFNN